MNPVDHAAAARAGISRDADCDHRPVYDSTTSLFPRGWDEDPGRYEADGCWPALTAQRLIGSSVPRWRVTCRNCHVSWHGWSEAEAMQKARRAHGD